MALKQLPVLRERGVCCELPDVDPDWAEQTSDLLKALADPTRLTMMASLWKAEAPVCICDLTASLGLGQSTISHHMAKLKDAGLVDSDKRGIWIHYRVRDKLSPGARRLLDQLIT
ncbi:MAG: ArsR/SmtB family transcription factor [Candidatus Dormibacterales bacterium]